MPVPIRTASASPKPPIFFEKAESNFEQTFPNHWAKINKEKIIIYPYNRVSDQAIAADGSLWIVGGFGIIHQTLDGQQTWFSIQNGLPNNYFNTVAISPKGEVWAGGNNNVLLRFDGQQWIDEGVKLPPPLDDRTGYLCYSKTVSGIDFGPDGSPWMMNNGIEIYRQVYKQWINVPFPKDILPMAGGGACPLGIRVKAEDNITIKIGPC